MFAIFKKMAKVSGSLSNSKDAYSQILSLPIYPSISKKQQDLVIHNIEKYEDWSKYLLVYFIRQHYYCKFRDKSYENNGGSSSL